MGFDPFSAIATGVGGLLNFGVGVAQRSKGRKLMKAAGEQPLQEMPSELMENQTIARQNAATGLPSEQYAMAMKNLQRQQVAALSNANSRRGGLSLIPKIQQASDDASLKLDVANANARMQNQRTLYGVNSQVAGWKDKLYNNNVLTPWNRKYQYAQSLTGAGNSNAVGGLDQLAAGGLMYGYGSGGGSDGNNPYITPSNRPRTGLNYIPYDEQFPG